MKKILWILLPILIICTGFASYFIVYHIFTVNDILDVRLIGVEDSSIKVTESELYEEETFYEMVKPSVIEELDGFGIPYDNLDLCERKFVIYDDYIYLGIYLDNLTISVSYYEMSKSIGIDIR